MSFLTGGKSKEKDPFSKKSNFYVEFLGWMECRGLRGHKYTDPVIRELRRRQKKMETPPKLTIQVSRKELKITQDVEEKKRKNIKKIKFPTIPARDVTYVVQATRPSDGRLDDIVACIYLGYMPRTQRYVHIHVYRFDEASTATTFAQQMGALVAANGRRIHEVELELASKGEVDDPRLTNSDGMSDPHTTDSAVGSASSAYSDDEAPTFGSDDIDPDLQSLKDVQPFDNVAEELKFRLQFADSPLLLPPKDYDTISRAHGNLEQINRRRCLNLNVVKDNAIKDVRERNGSNESGVDMTSPLNEQVEPNTCFPPGDVIPSPSQQQPVAFPSSTAAGPGSRGGSIHSGSHHSGNTSPEVPTNEIFYPPKTKSPPMSPRLSGGIYRPMRGPQSSHLMRQGSQNSGFSFKSEGSRVSQHSDGNPHGDGIVVYRGGSSNDIYAMPVKNKAGAISPREEIPPADYLDDDDDVVQLRGAGPRYRQPNLTRSMPADLIRSEMALGSSRMGGSDFRPLQRIDSPTFVGGSSRNREYREEYSPQTRRVNSSYR